MILRMQQKHWTFSDKFWTLKFHLDFWLQSQVGHQPTREVLAKSSQQGPKEKIFLRGGDKGCVNVAESVRYD